LGLNDFIFGEGDFGTGPATFAFGSRHAIQTIAVGPLTVSQAVQVQSPFPLLAGDRFLFAAAGPAAAPSAGTLSAGTPAVPRTA